MVYARIKTMNDYANATEENNPQSECIDISMRRSQKKKGWIKFTLNKDVRVASKLEGIDTNVRDDDS